MREGVFSTLRQPAKDRMEASSAVACPWGHGVDVLIMYTAVSRGGGCGKGEGAENNPVPSAACVTQAFHTRLPGWKGAGGQL